MTIRQNVAGGCLVGLDSTTSVDVIQRITILDNPSFTDICSLEIRKSAAIERSTLAGVEEIDIINPSGTVLTIGNLLIDGILGSQNQRGFIQASLIGQIDVGGHWYARVTANNQASSSVRNITLARTDGAFIGGKIINNEGDINSVQVGLVAATYANDPPEIWASGTIGEVSIAGDATVKIGVNSEGFLGIPDVGEVTIGGDFGRVSDPIALSTMNSLGMMEVGGILRADIAIQNPMSATSVYRAGDSFVPGASITLPANGLAGQITFNNNDAGGTWLGDVIVGGVTLSPIGYAETAASIGGGAAGAVPFGLHGSSSVPVQDGNINPLTNVPFSVRYYGPVGFGGIGVPVTVERVVIGSSGFSDQTAGFTYGVTGAGEHFLTATPVASYEFQNGYAYSVTAIISGADRLFCKGAAGDPGVSISKHIFTVGTSCTADINGDEAIGTADLGILLGNFGGSGLSERGDLNNDGVVDTADLGLLLAVFNTTCGAEAMMGGGGPTVSPFIAEMGFTSIEDYIAWLDSLSEERLAAHIVRILEWIEEN